MLQNGVVLDSIDAKTGARSISFDVNKAQNYSFEYDGKKYASSIEIMDKNRGYMFWLRMPYDMCFTFGSDNSHP